MNLDVSLVGMLGMRKMHQASGEVLANYVGRKQEKHLLLKEKNKRVRKHYEPGSFLDDSTSNT